jgi:hypothetical protein
MVNQTELATVVRYPEIQRLIDLKIERPQPPWIFQPHVIAGHVELLTGWRAWLVGGWTESIAIRDRGDAKAYRCDPAGGEVWDREGSLIEVIDGLIELPGPDEPGAPRLVKGALRKLWLPGMGM